MTKFVSDKNIFFLLTINVSDVSCQRQELSWMELINNCHILTCKPSEKMIEKYFR